MAKQELAQRLLTHRESNTMDNVHIVYDEAS